MSVAKSLDEHIANGVRQRYDLKERERQDAENEYEPCYFLHGGKWDIEFDELSKVIQRSVLAVAQSELEANLLMDFIFKEVKVSAGDSGGDHHGGYFKDYDVFTSGAVALARNTEELGKYLKTK